MKLNTPRDVVLKRYLNKIGDSLKTCISTESKYYKISYSDNLSIIVRFSDHYHAFANEDINIVRTSVGIYVIQTRFGLSYSVREEDSLDYVKSLLILFPEIRNTLEGFRDSAFLSNTKVKECKNQVNALTTKIASMKSDYEDAYNVLLTNDKLSKENQKLRIANNNLKLSNDSLKLKVEKFREQNSKLASFKVKILNAVKL